MILAGFAVGIPGERGKAEDAFMLRERKERVFCYVFARSLKLTCQAHLQGTHLYNVTVGGHRFIIRASKLLRAEWPLHQDGINIPSYYQYVDKAQ